MSRAKSVCVRINVAWLRKQKACENWVAVVEAEIGSSTVTLTRARLLKADALRLDLSWLLRKLLHSPGVGRRRKLTAAEVKRLFGFMTKLSLYDSQISDLSVLADLTNLVCLHLYDNQISDISPLAGLTSLMRLGLSGNPLNTAAAGVIEKLKERGVRVYE